ncbi:hypothetical protein QBC46DRAFT_347489 [Diplogelasinospora grovesii]|uniref:Uncharacterized protein n=1 Tax=Diplogelasinospora grovesii TaxID=303347 RepID=A0AAN6MWX5_9PEZI|nr:hypothetical protein QBC46DRAFT_347489 [Diplogelasinospora grovesii]
METYRLYTTWTKTAEYFAEQVKEKTQPLQEKLPDEVRISFSPAFLIAYVGPWTQVNEALGTKLEQEEYNKRIQIVQETEALVRESRAKSTASSNAEANSPPATESASTRSWEESRTTLIQPINADPQGRDRPTTSNKRRRTSRELRHGNSHLAEVPVAQNASPLGFELLLVASGQVERSEPCHTTLNSPAESGPLADETVAQPRHDPPFREPADISTREEGANAEQRFTVENPGRTNSVVPTLRPAEQASRSGYEPVPGPNVNLLDLTSTGQVVTGVNRRYAAIGRNSPDGAGGERLRHGHDDATASHRTRRQMSRACQADSMVRATRWTKAGAAQICLRAVLSIGFRHIRHLGRLNP